MENTSALLDQNDENQYFIATKQKIVGPLSAHEVKLRVQKGKSSLADYIWCKGWGDWKRIYEHSSFAKLSPQKPPKGWISQIREKLGDKTPAPVVESLTTEKQYYLYFHRSQYGPFTKLEVLQIVEDKKLGSHCYVWVAGWANWKRLSEIPELAKKQPTREHTIGVRMKTDAGVDATDKRQGGPRRPLVARLFMHNNDEVVIAVCRDISVGGMQVLTDHVPGELGATIKINVAPSDSKKVQGFVAEGQIVRLLEDGRGFSFRFTKISDDARLAIERYIAED